MIGVTCLSGPFAGRTRIPPANMDPAELFASLVQHGWTWEVDYSGATEEEILVWFRAELVARMMRALRAGLPVSFMGRQYQLQPSDDLAVVAQELEDAVVASNRLITIDSDDERGLVIGVRGYEAM